MAMTYGYVYVASVAMGADKNQMLKAFKEAEAYDGPSLIICYAPCYQPGHQEGHGARPSSNKSWPWPPATGRSTATIPSLRTRAKIRSPLNPRPRTVPYRNSCPAKTVTPCWNGSTPELSKAFREQIEKDYANRYATLTHLAGADFGKAGGRGSRGLRCRRVSRKPRLGRAV